jgi:hypothetical protein
MLAALECLLAPLPYWISGLLLLFISATASAMMHLRPPTAAQVSPCISRVGSKLKQEDVQAFRLMVTSGLGSAMEGYQNWSSNQDPGGLIAAVDGANCALYGLLCLLGVDEERALFVGFTDIAEITREARTNLPGRT